MSEVEWLSALRSGNVDEVKSLIKRAKEEEPAQRVVFSAQSTPLHWCAERGDVDLFSLVMNAKLSDVNDKDASGATPMHWAAGEGHLEIVTLLAEQKCDVNSLDFNQESPLHYACLSGHVHCVAYLLKRGAKINEMSGAGHTPLHLATLNRFVDIVSLLIDHRADVNAKAPTADAKSALEIAQASDDHVLLANFNPKEKVFR